MLYTCSKADNDVRNGVQGVGQKKGVENKCCTDVEVEKVKVDELIDYIMKTESEISIIEELVQKWLQQ